MLIRSRLLTDAGFVHGFSDRQGGVSVGPFATLNLARTVGDEAAHVEENGRRFAEALGISTAHLMEVSQIHGRRVVRVGPDATVNDVRAIEADALFTDVLGHAVAVRTADCVPLLVADVESGAVAAVHAGWRGVVGRVLHATLVAMREVHRTRTSAVLVAIGPHIRRYEVGDDVAARLDEAGLGTKVIERDGPRPIASLASTLRAQLAAFGVSPAQIEDVGGCTLDEPARFFSHRRDRGHTGRHLSAIVARRR